MSNVPFIVVGLPNVQREESFGGKGFDACSMQLIKSAELMFNKSCVDGSEAVRFFLGVLHPPLFRLACWGLLLLFGPNVGCVFFNSIDWVVFE